MAGKGPDLIKKHQDLGYGMLNTEKQKIRDLGADACFWFEMSGVATEEMQGILSCSKEPAYFQLKSVSIGRLNVTVSHFRPSNVLLNNLLASF